MLLFVERYSGLWEYTTCSGCNSDVNNMSNQSPLFIDSLNDNVNLQSLSPAIDAWKNTLVFDKPLPSFAPISRDLNWIMRQGTYDIWAYEYFDWSIIPPSDTTPPILWNWQATWQQLLWTTNVNLTLTTDENAFCKYSTEPNTLYSSMSDSFVTTWTTTHSINIWWLTDGNSYTYYVRCVDGSWNENLTDYEITFSITEPIQQISTWNIVFEDNFDNHPDWMPLWSTGWWIVPQDWTTFRNNEILLYFFCLLG